MFTQEQLVAYVNEVRDRLDDELQLIQRHMLLSTQKHDHHDIIIGLNQCFKALLTEKARQKAVEQMRQHNSRSTQSRGPSPAHNAPRSIGTWNILKQQIA